MEKKNDIVLQEPMKGLMDTNPVIQQHYGADEGYDKLYGSRKDPCCGQRRDRKMGFEFLGTLGRMEDDRRKTEVFPLLCG